MNSGSAYTPGREIARGGMGAILAATEQSLDREVAMKVLLAEDQVSSIARQRFRREALILARLEHPNIVPIHELGRNAQGQLYYTMKLVKGRTLQAILTALQQGDELTTRHYTLDRLLTIYRKVCDAVAFAHHQRIIHRDLKPENVMVGEFGEVLVMDWGLAKHLDDEHHAQTETERSQSSAGFQELSDTQLAAGDSGLTIEGAVIGSPQYMPPEQAEGRLADIGPHSDIYSLGGILYSILTLRPPVTGRKVAEVLDNVKSGNITPPMNYSRSPASRVKVSGGEVADADQAVGLPHCPDGKVPASLSAVAMRALARQPKDRYANVAQISADVEAYQGGFATSAEDANALKLLTLFLRRNKALTAAAAFVVLLTIGFMAKVIASEQKATAYAKTAEGHAHTAEVNEAKAKATLADLHRTAPIFAAQARIDLETGKADEAIAKIGYAIQLDDTNADYHLFRAHLSQSSQKLADATAGYRRVLALRPADASAKTNLALSEKLQRESGGAALTRQQQLQLLAALREQKRLVEAAPLAALVDPDIALAKAALISRLREYHKQPNWTHYRVKALPDGTFEVNLSTFAIGDLSVLQGQPVSVLKLDYSNITDLSSLAGLPLKELWLQFTKVADLSPLRGMPLESLILEAAPVTDLSPLRGMKLRNLNIGKTGVSDLSPLAGMPLARLDCHESRSIADLTPLKGAPLVWFTIQGASRVRSLAPLAGAPLKLCTLGFLDVHDLSPLAECRELVELVIVVLPVTDLTPLAKLPLTKLRISGVKTFTDISPLRGMPLRSLHLPATAITDFSPLTDCPTLEELILPETPSLDLEPLRQLPKLRHLSTRAVGPPETAEEFWKEYDAKQKASKK